MPSLFESVIEGSYTTESYSGGISADVDAEIENRIEDSYSLAAYTGECFENMVAAEAAMYAIESQCSVKYLQSVDESSKEEAKATMEASVRGAWETIKDWASRAWEAIKKFIKKIWGKLKGYASMVKTFFKKYRQLLASGKGDKAPIMWGTCNVQAALDECNKWADHVKTTTAAVWNDTKNWQTFRDELYAAVWGSGNSDYTPKESTFGAHKAEAIKVADMGFDKYLQGFLKLGETKQKEFYSETKSRISKVDDHLDKLEGDDSRSGLQDHLKDVKHRYQRILKVIQECVSTYNKAANKMYSQSVKACRVAMRYSHGDKTATGVESYTDFNAMMAEIL